MPLGEFGQLLVAMLEDRRFKRSKVSTKSAPSLTRGGFEVEFHNYGGEYYSIWLRDQRPKIDQPRIQSIQKLGQYQTRWYEDINIEKLSDPNFNINEWLNAFLMPADQFMEIKCESAWISSKPLKVCKEQAKVPRLDTSGPGRGLLFLCFKHAEESDLKLPDWASK